MKDYGELVKHPNVQAFLALIRFTEGAGYMTLFGGAQFDDYADHPRQVITKSLWLMITAK